MSNSTIEAKVVYATHLPDALRMAREYAGDDGFVASMPQLLHGRVGAPFDNEIWDKWFFTSNSEESMVTTSQGNHVAVFVHGGGIFSTPGRFRKLYLSSTDRHSKNGFTGLFGGKILEQEGRDILEGQCPDGTEFPIYSFDEFRNGISSLPRRYGIAMDFDTARTSKCGMASYDELKDDPIMIVRAGGPEAAAEYLDKAREYYDTTEMGSWHRFDDMEPMHSQTWIPFVYDCNGGASRRNNGDASRRTEGEMDIWFTHYRISRDAGFGIRADTALINTARYVAVAPQDQSIGVRHLPFTV